MDKEQSLKIGKKSFLTSVAILLSLMLIAGLATQMVPAGTYERVEAGGRQVIVAGSFRYLGATSYPFWRVFTAPFEVFRTEAALTVSIIILFLLVIGGAFSLLDRSGFLRYGVEVVVRRFGSERRRLIAALTLFFMLFGALFGIFEELVALVPLVVFLSLSLGWDRLMGMGMSAMATGLGFSAALFNPFTLGVAQSIAGLPAFSGILFRIFVFAGVYILQLQYLFAHARKLEAAPGWQENYKQQRENLPPGRDSATPEAMKQAVWIFLTFVGLIFGLIVLGFFLPAVGSISMPLVALLFAIASILVTGRLTYRGRMKAQLKDFSSGVLAILPAVLLILMAMSVKVIVTEGMILDSLLYALSGPLTGLPPYMAILLLFVLIMFLNFFIGSGSAKAFLVLPLILPMSDLVGLTRQSAVQAFLFGDGFSNLMYPTNAVLMIALGLSGLSFTTWFRFSWRLQLRLLLFATVCLLLAVAIGYGPL